MRTIARQGPYELVYDGDQDGLSWGHIKEDGRHLMPPRPLITLLSHGEWEPVDGAETAAGVRRVRTVAGEKKYGQPIGTVITKDAERQAKATLTPILGTPVKWRDLKIGDRFYDAMGQLSEVVQQQQWTKELQDKQVMAFARAHPEIRLRDPNALFPEEGVVEWEDLIEKAWQEWVAKNRGMTLLVLDGPYAGQTQTATGVANPEHEFTKIPVPEDPWFQDVVFPVADAIKALDEKYPQGIEIALKEAMTPAAGPEPQMSPELKRLMATPEIQKWDLRDMPAAEARLRAANAAREEFMLGNVPKMSEDDWRAEMRRLTKEQTQAREDLWQLKNLGGVYAEYRDLLQQHRTEYHDWQERTRREADPRTPAAQAVLADVEAVGTVAREKLRIAVQREMALSGESLRAPQPEDHRRKFARRLVASLQQTATSTNQTWPSDVKETTTMSGRHRDLLDNEREMLTTSLLLYPKGWVEKFDDFHTDYEGDTFTADMSHRGYYDVSTGHISLSYHDDGLHEDGGSLQEVAVHELGHGMEKCVPGLKELESVFWFKRVGEKVEVRADDYAYFPITPAQPTRRDYSLKYYGMAPEESGVRKAEPKVQSSWEVFTTGVQEVLGTGDMIYTVRRDPGYSSRDDYELWDLTMGALLTLRPQSKVDRTREGRPTSADTGIELAAAEVVHLEQLKAEAAEAADHTYRYAGVNDRLSDAYSKALAQITEEINTHDPRTCRDCIETAEELRDEPDWLAEILQDHPDLNGTMKVEEVKATMAPTMTDPPRPRDLTAAGEFTATLGGRRGWRGIITDERSGREIFQCEHIHGSESTAKKCAKKQRQTILYPPIKATTRTRQDGIEILSVTPETSYDFPRVTVTPFREGDMQVESFYLNGGVIVPAGYLIKKDGTLGPKRETGRVPAPPAVVEALRALDVTP